MIEPQSNDNRFPKASRAAAQGLTAAARILFIERNTDGTVGGSQRSLLDVVRHLDRARFEPVVLFYADHILVPEYRRHARVLIFSSGSLRMVAAFPKLHRWLSRAPPLLWVALALQKAFNFFRHAVPWFIRTIRTLVQERIDLVCLNNAPYSTDWLLACKLMGRPCVSYFRGTPAPISRWHGRLFGRYDAVLSISLAVTENARRQGAAVDRFTLVYNGIDADALRRRVTRPRDETRREFLSEPGRLLIGVVNHLREWKGQQVAVEAMRLLRQRRPDVMCLLIGDVAESDRCFAENLRKRVEEYGLSDHVIFTGERLDVPDLLLALDLVLHTSLANEGLPRVILEAMSLGRPMIVSSAGSNVEMIEDGVSGYLVPPGDPGALADRIDAVLDDPGEMAEVGRRAQERAQRLFNIDTNVRKTEGLFSRLLRTHL